MKSKCEIDKTNKMTTNFKDRILELEKKYFELVWAARCSDKLRKEYKEVKRKYPEEVKRLNSSSGDWEHGFNSGALAVLRLLIPYSLPDDYLETNDGYEWTKKDEITQAEEEFPMLDT